MAKGHYLTKEETDRFLTESESALKKMLKNTSAFLRELEKIKSAKRKRK